MALPCHNNALIIARNMKARFHPKLSLPASMVFGADSFVIIVKFSSHSNCGFVSHLKRR
jgi:hypothetical protein